jgi:hypothetical protein
MHRSSPSRRVNFLTVAALSGGLLCADPVSFSSFSPGNLVLSRSAYSGTASSVTIGQQLPPVCGAMATCSGKATDNGSFPAIGSTNNVWNNDLVDSSFGITTPSFSTR